MPEKDSGFASDAGRLGHYGRFLTKWKSKRELDREPLTIILSPHMDDALLSLGSMLESKMLGKNIFCINVFTLSDSMVNTNTKTDFSAIAKTSIIREKEEMAFAQHLASKGVNYIPAFLGVKEVAVDAYYSHMAGKSIKNLPGMAKGVAKSIQNSYMNKRMDKLSLGSILDPLITQFGGSVAAVLAPIGIGDHIDHMLLRSYAEKNAGRFRVGLYADIPYIYEYKYCSIEKLRSALPDGFAERDTKRFDAKTKNAMFRSIYKSQYSGSIEKELGIISETVGECVFWNSK